jgi:hypothetical protein
MKRGRPASPTHFGCGHERLGNTYASEGHTDRCLICKNRRSREYYKLNREYFIDYARQHRG